MLSPKIIYLKTAPTEFNFLLFDAESENYIPENTPPPLEFNFLLFDAESENHIPENSPPPPKIQLSTLWCRVWKLYTWKQPPCPLPPAQEFNFLLFDAESENYTPENSPPPPRIQLSTFWCRVRKSYTWKQPPPPGSQKRRFLMPVDTI